MKTVRTPNFAEEEVKLLVELVRKHSNVLENKASNAVNWNARKSKWEELTCEFNSRNAISRTADALRKKWDNTKKNTRQKFATKKQYRFQTGGGPAAADPGYTQIEESVMELLSDQVTGVQSTHDCDANSDDDMYMIVPEEMKPANLQRKYSDVKFGVSSTGSVHIFQSLQSSPSTSKFGVSSTGSVHIFQSLQSSPSTSKFGVSSSGSVHMFQSLQSSPSTSKFGVSSTGSVHIFQSLQSSPSTSKFGVSSSGSVHMFQSLQSSPSTSKFGVSSTGSVHIFQSLQSSPSTSKFGLSSPGSINLLRSPQPSPSTSKFSHISEESVAILTPVCSLPEESPSNSMHSKIDQSWSQITPKMLRTPINPALATGRKRKATTATTNAKWSSLAEFKMKILTSSLQNQQEEHLLKMEGLKAKRQEEEREHILRTENLKAKRLEEHQEHLLRMELMRRNN